jgi:hypothetical protein
MDHAWRYVTRRLRLHSSVAIGTDWLRIQAIERMWRRSCNLHDDACECRDPTPAALGGRAAQSGDHDTQTVLNRCYRSRL